MNIFTFIRYGNNTHTNPNIIKICLIMIHYLELILFKQNTYLLFVIGIIWSLVEFLLVIFQKRLSVIPKQNYMIIVLLSIIRGFSEGGVIISIGQYKNIFSSIFLILSPIISYYFTKNISVQISKRNVGYYQMFLCFLISLYYLNKKEKSYSLVSSYYMILLGFIWNIIGHLFGIRHSLFLNKNNFLNSCIAYLYDSIFEIGFLYAGLIELYIDFFTKIKILI